MHHSRIREKAVSRSLVKLFFDGISKIFQEYAITKGCVVANVDESEVPQNVTIKKAYSRFPVYGKVSDVRTHVSAVPLIFGNGERGGTCYLITGNPEREVPGEYMAGAGDHDVAFFSPKGFVSSLILMNSHRSIGIWIKRLGRTSIIRF
jgi:hypothetical protein